MQTAPCYSPFWLLGMVSRSLTRWTIFLTGTREPAKLHCFSIFSRVNMGFGSLL